MPRLKPTALKLTTEEREELGQILNRHQTPQQIALRAKIVVLADEGRNHHEIARELEISLKMARMWRKRWMDGQEKNIPVAERLCDRQRSGTPAKFELEQILHLFKLACDNPNDYNRPISQWTNRELAAEMVEQKIVQEISPRHVGRLLAEAELKPHQSGYWLNPPPTKISMPR